MTKIEAIITVLNGNFKVKAQSHSGNFITLSSQGTLTWNGTEEVVACDYLDSDGFVIVEDEIGKRIFNEN